MRPIKLQEQSKMLPDFHSLFYALVFFEMNDNSSKNKDANKSSQNEMEALDKLFESKEYVGDGSVYSKIPEDFQSCNKIWESFTKCMSVSYQMSHIHRTGSAKGCTDRFHDFRKCLYVKVLKDEKQIMVILSFLLSKFFYLLLLLVGYL
jgi:hypothetical protein